MRFEMNDKVYENYKLAGRIAAETRDYGAGLIKSGVSFLEVANNVESKIMEKGAGLAFPVNVSVNEVAAHYSPRHDDKLVFKKGDVVKLDLGAHIDGYIADTAITVEVETNKYDDMVKASSDALDAAIGTMKANVDLIEVGKAVKETINSYGFKPIKNLTGHSMQRYVIHAGMSVPNVPEATEKGKPQVGDVLAIEPFATNGAGYVSPGEGSNIYICKDTFNPRLIRDRNASIIYRKIKGQFKTLPFAQRWVEKQYSNGGITLRKLMFLGLIKHYPQLIDAKKGIVTQKEHTVLINEEGCEVIT